jgi:glucose-6-phosphate dehydrogenase assembly protein OpcA
MATTYKVLGQVNPSATTNTTLYTVPSSTQAVVSTISVCNLTSGSLLYRIAIRPAGEAIANKHYIAYDVTLAASDSTMITVGATLGATDVVTVYASSGSVTFNAYGSEIA